ncbi:MAG: prolyl oligopeptidase family serine peptidase [Natronosporangium sp.]
MCRRCSSSRALRAWLTSPKATWQPAKLAARLQAATGSGRPVLLRVEEHGGHGFGATTDQQDALLADQLAFLLDRLSPAGGGAL